MRAAAGGRTGWAGRSLRAARLLILSVRSRLKPPAPDISDPAEGLGMQSAAPVRSAWKVTVAPRWVKDDSMITLIPGTAFRMPGRAVSPSITGISMSSTTTSTGLRDKAAMACSPLEAWAATLMAGSSARMRETRPRTMAESSTSMTVIGPGGGGTLDARIMQPPLDVHFSHIHGRRPHSPLSIKAGATRLCGLGLDYMAFVCKYPIL